MQKHGNEKSPWQTVHKYTVFFELLLTYQELLYFNFCLDFHMVCMYFKKFQSNSSIKSSNLSPDCVWQFIFRCFYSGFSCKYQDKKRANTVSTWQVESAFYHFFLISLISQADLARVLHSSKYSRFRLLPETTKVSILQPVAKITRDFGTWFITGIFSHCIR